MEAMSTWPPADVQVDTAHGAHGDATATFSPCRQYRYSLTRRWSDGPMVTFILCNPSTADAFKLDPTLTRALNLARREGAAAMTVVNIFALRATDPQVMRRHAEPIGRHNDAAILEATRNARTTIAGWGTHGEHRRRATDVLALLGEHPIHRMGPPTKAGHPRHPLYLPLDVTLHRHP